MSGLFVAIEGVDGVGKSTQVRCLAERLTRDGKTTRQVREPGDTPVGEKLRTMLLGRALPLRTETELLLFLACRVELYEEVIGPALARDEVVISDRYHLSSVVYQGFAGSLGEGRAAAVIDAVLGERRPHLSIVLDLPLDACLDRLGVRPDRFESSPQRLRRVWQGFRATKGLPGDRIVHVDGTGAPEAVAERIFEVVADAM